MIGQTVVRRDGKARFHIVGFDQGAYLLQAVEHGVTFTATPRELRKDYGAPRAEAPAEGSPADFWERISARLGALVSRRPRMMHAPTPEAVIREGDRAAAKAIALKIVADESKIGDFQAALLPVSDAVAAEVEALLASRRGD